MPSSRDTDRNYEPVYVDDLNSLRQRDIPPPVRTRPQRRHYDDDYMRPPKPHRSRTHREPPVHYYGSDSDSAAPAPKPRRRRESLPRSRKHRDDHSSHHRRHREEDYFSDNRHNRYRKDPYDSETQHREKRKERDPKKERPKQQERRSSRLQKAGQDMFKEYAVPALKAEAGKLITKQIGNFFAKQ